MTPSEMMRSASGVRNEMSPSSVTPSINWSARRCQGPSPHVRPFDGYPLQLDRYYGVVLDKSGIVRHLDSWMRSFGFRRKADQIARQQTVKAGHLGICHAATLSGTTCVKLPF
jgi:hypothetical protein